LTDAAVPVPETPPLKGIRGWLLLLAIGLCLAPLRTLADLGQAADGYVQLWQSANGWPVVVGELAINLVLLGLQAVTAVALLNKMKRFKTLLTWLWIAAVVLPLADVVLVLSYFPQGLGGAVGNELARVGFVFIGMGLWVWYAHTSVRVANTCTN
jgi:hypothetical protein